MSLFPEIDFSNLRTYPIKKRKNLVQLKHFIRLTEPPQEFKRFIEGWPDLLASRDFKYLIQVIVRAYRTKRLIGVDLGTHVIKCGLSPVIIDLVQRGIITAIALTGGGAIHDYEISLIGGASEDVNKSLPKGKYDMCKETAQAFSRAAQKAVRENIGLGLALGKLIHEEKNPFLKYSILATAFKQKIPATVHIAFGTDTIHMHPEISGETMGQATMRDFRIFSGVVSQLEKGVWLNIGSAVILPEVFLKAVALAHNLGYPLNKPVTANLDMIQHYRPTTNVTGRPAKIGINLTGHHEIMLPLLRWAILSYLIPDKKKNNGYHSNSK